MTIIHTAMSVVVGLVIITIMFLLMLAISGIGDRPIREFFDTHRIARWILEGAAVLVAVASLLVMAYQLGEPILSKITGR